MNLLAFPELNNTRPRPSRRAPRRAMTLIEVMIAFFVLVVVFGGVLASIVHAAAITRDSKVIYRETAIVNDLVERMRSMTFAELAAELKTVTTGEVPPPSGAGTGPVLAGAYTYRWERTCTDLTADPLRIKVRIWPVGRESHSVTVVTYISASGLINKEAKK